MRKTSGILGLLFLFALSQSALATGEGSQSFTLDGRLYGDSSGSAPMVDPNITMKLQILDQTQTCILYEETQSSIDTTTTNGYFTVGVGSAIGAGKRSSGDSAHLMAQVYSNTGGAITGKLVSNGAACSYTPVSGHRRYMRVSLLPSLTGVTNVLSPNMALDSVPMAVVAERAESLQGLTPSSLVQVNTTAPASLSQSNLENIFSVTNYPALTSLLAGTSGLYSQIAANGTETLPTVSSPASPTAGQVWYDSGSIKYYNGSSTQTLGVSGAGISSLVVGAGLTPTGTITTSGSIAVDTGTTTGKIVQVAASNKLPVIDGSNLTLLNGSAINSGTIGGTTAITTSGNIAAGTGSFTSTSMGQLSLYDDPVTSTNYITLRTPNTATLTANYTLTLPPALPGVTGQVLTSDTSGTLSWTTPTAGSVTSITGTAPITITGTASVPIVNVSAATTAASGVVSLAANGGTTATTVVQATDSRLSDSRAPNGTATGDLSASYPNPTVAKIQGTAVSATTPTTAGQTLRFDGTSWVPNFISMADLRSTVTGTSALTSCTSGQTLTWSAATDNLACSNIVVTASNFGSQTANTILAAPSGSAGTPTFRALTATDLPSGVVTPGSYNSVTVDTYGRVTAGTAPTTIAGYNITDAVKNLGGTPGVQTGADASKPVSPTAGTIYFATDTNKIWQYNSGAWATIASASASSYTGILPVANGGTNSSTALTNNKIMVSSGGAVVEAAALTNGQLLIGSTGAAPVAASITAGSGITVTPGAGSISIATSGLGNTTLADGKIWVGQTTTPTQVTPGGDLSMTNAGSFTVAKAQGVNISATAPTISGQTLRYNTGTSSWEPKFISMADLRSTITGASALTSCTSGQTLTWSVATDNLACSNITVAASNFGSQTANTVLAAPSGSAGTPTFRALTGTDLPNPSASTLGGVQSIAAVASNWVRSISTSGVPTLSQPAFSDISGTANLASQTTGVLPVANGGTGTSNGSITGTGALGFTAGGSNQNITLTPSGTGYSLLGGNVGIGTTSPQNNLQIGSLSSSSTATPVTLSLGGTYSSTAGANPKLKLYEVGGTVYGIGVSSGSVDIMSGADTNWYVGGVQKMRLSSAGDLSVNGTGYIYSTLVVNDAIRTASTSTTTGAIVSGGGLGVWGTENLGGDLHVGGSVGIGTTNPAAKLTLAQDVTRDFWGENPQLKITGATDPNKGIKIGYDTTSNYGWIFSSVTGTSTSPLALQPVGGNVGIGTTAPLAKLDVVAPTAVQAPVINLIAGGGASGVGEGAALSFLHSAGERGFRIYERAIATHVGELRFAGGNNSGSYTDRMVIDASGNVGIGTTTPGAKLDVSTAVNGLPVTSGTTDANVDFRVRSNTNLLLDFGSSNSPVVNWIQSRDTTTYAANYALALNPNGGSVGIGTTSPSQLLTLNSAGFTGFDIKGTGDTLNYAGMSLINPTSGKTWLVTHTQNQADNLGFQYYDGTSWHSNYVVFSPSGSVGIGTTSPAYTLDVNGSARATGSVAAWSDIRAKKNIEAIPDALNKILKVRGVTFDWRHDEFPNQKFKQGRDMGVIAQEIETVFPEAVQTAPDGFKSVAYPELVAPLIEAVKELLAKILNHDQSISIILSENAKLKVQVERQAKALENQTKAMDAQTKEIEAQKRDLASIKKKLGL